MASKASEIQRPNDVPKKIGKYVIINKIGKGSTGTVYLSHDPYYRRDVAIKVYNSEEDPDAERAKVSRKMFFNEAHMVGMTMPVKKTARTTLLPSIFRVRVPWPHTAVPTTCYALMMS
jgi:serine/threonine protein kinase